MADHHPWFSFAGPKTRAHSFGTPRFPVLKPRLLFHGCLIVALLNAAPSLLAAESTDRLANFSARVQLEAELFVAERLNRLDELDDLMAPHRGRRFARRLAGA